MALESELEAYRRLRPELVATRLGQFVLVKGSKLVGAYPSYEAALRDATRLYGAGPFLIKQVLDPEPVETI